MSGDTGRSSSRTTDAADLRRRIDRTLDYTDELLRLPQLDPTLVRVLRAVHESLCTPADSSERTA